MQGHLGLTCVDLQRRPRASVRRFFFAVVNHRHESQNAEFHDLNGSIAIALWTKLKRRNGRTMMISHRNTTGCAMKDDRPWKSFHPA